jgi:hypothetical protein
MKERGSGRLPEEIPRTKGSVNSGGVVERSILEIEFKSKPTVLDDTKLIGEG